MRAGVGAQRAAGWGLLAWGRLLRLSLAPSALADAAAGLAIGALAELPSRGELALALGASACAYHGGMVLNDWADRDADRATRPERPLPSGAVSSRAALAVGLGLLALAPLLALALSPRAALWMAGLAALILAYDFAGRGAWSGPLLLGACRAANLGFGLYYSSALSAQPLGVAPPGAPLLLALYGGYVVCASRVARLEDASSDAEVGSAPRLYMLLAGLLLLAPAFVDVARGWALPHLTALALAGLGAFGLLRAAAQAGPWTRADAGRATGLALRRLLIFTAAATLASAGDGGDQGIVVAALILCGFPLSAALRRVFPPT